jgi:hypothetical protein
MGVFPSRSETLIVDEAAPDEGMRKTVKSAALVRKTCFNSVVCRGGLMRALRRFAFSGRTYALQN